MIDHAAPGEGLVDLRIQVVTIGQNEEREVAAELAMHLAGEHHHRIALARPLCMPEDAQLAFPGLAIPNRLNRPIDA